MLAVYLVYCMAFQIARNTPHCPCASSSAARNPTSSLSIDGNQQVQLRLHGVKGPECVAAVSS